MRGEFEVPSQSHNAAHMRASRLMNLVPDGVGEKVLRAAIEEVFPYRVAALSSFGAESAVVLHMIASIDPATPVIFLDSGQLFAQTLQYQRELSDRLGLTNVCIQHPEAGDVAAADPDGMLWKTDPEACCHLRKVVPMERALEGFDAWITGRKRFQGGNRVTLPVVEVTENLLGVSPPRDVVCG